MSGLLSVLVPTTITAAMLTSTTATSEGYAAWDKTKTYAVGDYCYSASTQHNYRSLVANNLNKDPTDAVNRTAATSSSIVYWQDLGPANPWAMFDKKIGTATTANGNLTVVLRPGAFTDFYVVGVEGANSLTVTVRDAAGGEVVYTSTTAMEASAPDDYWEYFFDPFESQTDLLLTGLPPYGTGEATITLAGGGTVKCGAMAVGAVKVLGKSKADAEAEPTSFAFINTDQWGETDIVEGPSATNLSVQATTDTRDDGRKAQAIVTSLLGKPAFWFCSDRPDAAGLRTWGLGSGRFSYNSERCTISLTVKGMI
ncbi:hypothetical protein [Massilia sp. YIM B02763]|uniref:hypothetical protein n=1 Tax=Massilia sp. YIM B02763 TaxID=3050130 RepID=UPI0025B69C43|nr:hypothetical protein [Massilia sp. YIM B02763]